MSNDPAPSVAAHPSTPAAPTQMSDTQPRAAAANPFAEPRTAELPARVPGGLAPPDTPPAVDDGTTQVSGTESWFERNIVRIFAGAFAVFIALGFIFTATRHGLEGWEITDFLMILGLVGGLVLLAVYAVPGGKEPGPSEAERRFYELADPRRALTPEDLRAPAPERTEARDRG